MAAFREPLIEALALSQATLKLVGAFKAPAFDREPLYVGGVSRLAAEQEAFSTAQSAARLLELLEHQVVVVSVVHELLQAGLTVRIGSEHQLEELRECALVLAPYEVEGQAAGVVGVLGPTRMDYRHALAAVTAVSQQLGKHLS